MRIRHCAVIAATWALTWGAASADALQEAGRGAPAGRGAGGRGAAPAPAVEGPPIRSIVRNAPVDPDAHDRGRALWARECFNCHGAQGRGGEDGPNIIRSRTVNFDRYPAQAGTVLGPFLKAGHPTTSGKPSATFTSDETIALANFLRQRVNDTMRGSAEFVPGNILVGNAAAGEAYFNGEGGCTSCHNATARSLAGIATRIPAPVDLQQRMLFQNRGTLRGRGPGGTSAGNAITVSIKTRDGAVMSGVLVEQSDFYVTFRDAGGAVHVVRRAPGMTVVVTDPLQAHVDLLDRITDAQIHDLVAYLETLK